MATIKDLKRMCKNMACKDCPLSGSDVSDCWVGTVPDGYPDEDIDAIVDKWVTEHPVKTYMQDFFEKFPNAPKGKVGEPRVCPQEIYPGIDDMACTYCRYPEDCLKCWNREMGVNNEQN